MYSEMNNLTFHNSNGRINELWIIHRHGEYISDSYLFKNKYYFEINEFLQGPKVT